MNIDRNKLRHAIAKFIPTITNTEVDYILHNCQKTETKKMNINSNYKRMLKYVIQEHDECGGSFSVWRAIRMYQTRCVLLISF